MLLCATAFSLSIRGAGKPKIELENPLKQEIEVLLNEAIFLHKGLVDENSKQTIKAMRRILKQKKRVDVQLRKSKGNRLHLEKIVNAIQLNIENALNEEPKNRDDYYRAAFEQFVQIVKVFKVTEYPLFYCAKNKTVWFQEDKKKPKTPVSHKVYTTCGQLIRI